ncbi:uncharacterized protein Triagg1_7694 [Trichoderma aggressivum f. europaeum]|uniref:Serine hydrolase domain-containing protein n=1 Tax=Trichoderma aggressivum f. europaeum TaxID=173218 RepID=A0AAE1IBJ6_9HYPO|nr:hypothetical protein Triagg1_7694 [Trichoderma aggressivum f. europaeum]
MSGQKKLPRILCLHGAGSSAAIYRVQGRKIFSGLRNDFQFEFVESPFRSSSGPGMELFADSPPFYRWQCDMGASLSFDITADEVRAERQKVTDLLEGALLKKADGKQPFVGIMAFSQGARVATGLLLHLARMRRQGCDKYYNIRFAIISNATYPPLFLDDEMPETAEVLTIPTLHLHGSNDPWRPESEEMLAKFFDHESAKTILFEGKHQLPLLQADVDKVLVGIRGLAGASSPP